MDSRKADLYIKNKNNTQIYLTSDLHLFKDQVATSMPLPTDNIISILEERCSRLNDDDILLILGDIGHRKCQQHHIDIIMNIMNSLPCQKILVKGNHDLLDTSYYTDIDKCGFLFAVDELHYKNIVFTHKPIDIDSPYKYNIHGHLHGMGTYYECDEKNHFDVFTEDIKLLRLDKVLARITKNNLWK